MLSNLDCNTPHKSGHDTCRLGVMENASFEMLLFRNLKKTFDRLTRRLTPTRRVRRFSGEGSTIIMLHIELEFILPRFDLQFHQMFLMKV